jgi:Arc/MetJ-type ribon-helix-helix transcriptional regulator
MIHLSVKIPNDLHQQLEAKTHEMELPSMSDTVRVLLSAALEKNETDNVCDDKIQYKILENVITSYYLLKDQIEHSKEGIERSHASHERGKKAIKKILGQSSNQYETIE